MSQTIAVIGGGPAGLEAARGAAELGASVVLIEKENFLGGTPIREHYAALTPNMEPAEVAMGRLIEGVKEQPGIEVLLEHQVTACEGDAPDFRSSPEGGAGGISCRGAPDACTGRRAPVVSARLEPGRLSDLPCERSVRPAFDNRNPFGARAA